MKKEFFDELLQSVKEAAVIERGAAKPSRTFEIKSANDVVRVRTKLGISQPKFAGQEARLHGRQDGRRDLGCLLHQVPRG